MQLGLMLTAKNSNLLKYPLTLAVISGCLLLFCKKSSLQFRFTELDIMLNLYWDVPSSSFKRKLTDLGHYCRPTFQELIASKLPMLLAKLEIRQRVKIEFYGGRSETPTINSLWLSFWLTWIQYNAEQ